MQHYQTSDITSSVKQSWAGSGGVDVTAAIASATPSPSAGPLDDRSGFPDWADEDPYLEAYAQGGGGINSTSVDAQLAGVSYFPELGKIKFCGKTHLDFQGAESGDKYIKFLECMKWFCPKCGKKHGHIHNRRKRHLYDRLESIGGIDAYNLRQLVFTIPENQRHLFKTRKSLASLYRMVKRICEKEFPGRPMIEYFHAFGDLEPGKYHPHVNVHVLEPKSETLFLTPDRLSLIKTKFMKALKGFGCRDLSVVSVHYSFVDNPIKARHRIKYMSRPTPGWKNKEAILEDSELSMLFLVEMKGFQYIRYFGAWDKGGIEDAPDTKQDLEKQAGERLIYVGHGVMSQAEFAMRWCKYEKEEISPGFYRLRPLV